MVKNVTQISAKSSHENGKNSGLCLHILYDTPSSTAQLLLLKHCLAGWRC